MNGKGSARRPGAITEAEWAKRWAETFGKPEPQPDTPPDEGPIQPIQWLVYHVPMPMRRSIETLLDDEL